MSWPRLPGSAGAAESPDTRGRATLPGMRVRSTVVLALAGACLLASSAVGLGYSAAGADPAPDVVTFAIADDAAQRAFPSELASARAVGIGAARAYVGWADVAPTRPANPRNPADPAYDWAQTDADMARYASAGLAVWIALWRTPAWASGSSDVAVWPEDPTQLEDFAFAVATRYPQVHVFMDWNEPNLKLYAKPNTIEAYEPMARAVYTGVKTARPTAEVIAGNLGKYRDAGRDPAEWAMRLRADGVPMDAFGIHPYPDLKKPLSARSPRTRIDLFDVPALARLAGVPVAVTEFGWGSQDAGLANQAAWTAQAIDVARCTPGLSQLVFWGYHDHPVPAGQVPDPWVTFGWLDASGEPKPVHDAAGAALAATPDCAAVSATSGAPVGWPASNAIPPTETAPSCSDVALATVAGAAVAADVACVDPDGDGLAYSVTAPPAAGTLTQAGSVFSYQPNAGFAGSDAVVVSASDGTLSTPIAIVITVTPPAPPVVELPVVAPPVAAQPVAAAVPVAPTAVQLPEARVAARASVRKGVVSIGLVCGGGASCAGRIGLSADLNGTRRSLGSRAVGPGATRTIRLTLPTSARRALRAFAGKTIALAVAFVPSSGPRVPARIVALHLPG